MIRGRNVNEALAILRFSNKRAALGIEKCVKSAIANANEAAEKANIAVDPDELWLKAAYVDDGPTKHRRRLRPAPQGRAYRQQRHFCHVTVLLSSDERDGEGKLEGKPAAAIPAVSRRARRGGAAAAPRAKHAVKTKAAENREEKVAGEASEKKARPGSKKAATDKEAKAGEKKRKGSKLGTALRRRKKREKATEEE